MEPFCAAHCYIKLRSWRFLPLLLGLLLAVLVSYASYRPLALPALQLQLNLSSYRCTTGSSAQGPDFKIFTLSYHGATELADLLCASPALYSGYPGVTVVWGSRAQLKARDLIEQRYDLLLFRAAQARGMVSSFSANYEALLSYAGYPVHWYSYRQQPRAEASYFSRQRIGLVDMPQSYSRFILPLEYLKSLGLNPSQLSITFYPSQPLLAAAFGRGEVDLVSGPELLFSAAALGGDRRPLYSLPNNLRAAADAWHIRRQLPAPLRCTLGNAIVRAPSIYSSRQLSGAWLEQCGERVTGG
ncbi:MAG: hypothetical protein OIF38_09760 [Cellvibrionaceae bacterium]|nr:hypothetical protein [Cellvibrionaceae bacterium]